MAENTDDEDSLAIVWSPIYMPDWDEQPEHYLAHGVVGWGRSRRLARCRDDAHHFGAYLGVTHADPRSWGSDAASHTRFFLSIFILRRTVAMRTFATMAEARAELDAFHRQLVLRWPKSSDADERE